MLPPEQSQFLLVRGLLRRHSGVDFSFAMFHISVSIRVHESVAKAEASSLILQNAVLRVAQISIDYFLKQRRFVLVKL